MKIRFLQILPVLAVIVFSLSGPVQAQTTQPETGKIPNIPTFADEMSKEDFTASSDLYQETPLGDRFLAYKIRLPKKWTKVESSETRYKEFKKKDEKKKGDDNDLSERLLGEIAKYYGPTRLDALSRFEVKAQSLEYEVTAKNWFLHEILARGYSLEGLNVYSDRQVEALYVVVEKDTAYVVRALAEINGPRMVVASYYVPDNHWKEERAQQEWAMRSFKFISPEKTQIETTRSYAFLDLLTFEYPASWRLIAPNIYSIEGMEAKLVSSVNDKTLNGEINVSIVSNEYQNAISEELNYIKGDLKNRSLKIGDLIETRNGKYTFLPHVLYSNVEVYRLTNEDANILKHELWLAVMEEDRYYYIVSMITPGREGEFYTWARNAEAFETVITSIKP